MAEEVKVINAVEAIRRRPGMYVGALDEQGVHHMLYWAFDDILDNARAGRGTYLKVAVFADGHVSIIDDGPALPPADKRGGTIEERLERLTTEMPSVDRGTAPEIQVRSYLGTIRALSEQMVVEARVGDELYSASYARGEVVRSWERIDRMAAPASAQFRVVFWPDKSIFTSTKLDEKRLRARLQQMAATSPVLQTDFYYETDPDVAEPKYEAIRMPNGMADMLREIASQTKEFGFMPKEPFRLEVRQGALSFDIAIQWHWGNEVKRNLLLSWANTVKTSEGSHVLGVTDALWETGLDKLLYMAAVSVFVPQPRFSNPVKDCLRNPEIRQLIHDHLVPALRRLKADDQFALDMEYAATRNREDD